MGNLEANVVSFADRVKTARRRTEVEVNDPRKSVFLPAAMRRGGFAEDMIPRPDTVALWERKKAA